MKKIFMLLLCCTMFACEESDLLDDLLDDNQDQSDDTQSDDDESDDDDDVPEEDKVLASLHFTSFAYQVNYLYKYAEIDTVERLITIPDVVDSESITNVMYELNRDDITVSPDPKDLPSSYWAVTETIYLICGEDTVDYRIYLSDGVDALEPNANTINFTPTVRNQEILFYGGDMERSAHALQNQCANPEDVIEWSIKDIPFNSFRVAYDKKQELTEGEPNLAYYAEAIVSMQMIKEANPDIIFYSVMVSDYNGYNSSNNLPYWICDYSPTTYFYTEKYARFLADYLEIMEFNGVAIDYLATSKEWTSIVTVARAKETIEYLRIECEERGITCPQFIDAAAWSLDGGVSWIKNTATAGSMDYYAGFSTHSYSTSTSTWSTFAELATSYGKMSLADEVGYGNGATSGVEFDTPPTGNFASVATMVESGMSGIMFFEIWSRGYNTETRCIYFKSGGTATRMWRYYIVRQQIIAMAGGKFYTPYDLSEMEESENISTMAFVNDDELSICVINQGSDAINGVRLMINGDVNCSDWASTVTFSSGYAITGYSVNAVVTRNSVEINLPALSMVYVTIPLS